MHHANSKFAPYNSAHETYGVLAEEMAEFFDEVRTVELERFEQLKLERQQLERQRLELDRWIERVKLAGRTCSRAMCAAHPSNPKWCEEQKQKQNRRGDDGG